MSNRNELNLSKAITEIDVLLRLADPKVSIAERIHEILNEMQIKIVSQEARNSALSQENGSLKGEIKQLREELDKLKPKEEKPKEDKPNGKGKKS